MNQICDSSQSKASILSDHGQVQIFIYSVLHSDEYRSLESHDSYSSTAIYSACLLPWHVSRVEMGDLLDHAR